MGREKMGRQLLKSWAKLYAPPRCNYEVKVYLHVSRNGSSRNHKIEKESIGQWKLTKRQNKKFKKKI